MENIYITNKTNKMRYALGSDNGKILYVIGVNPSVASASKLDPTVTNVKKFAELLGYDSFIMLNLYPQRATNPDNIHKRINRAEHLKNLDVIDTLVKRNSTVWAAWGNLVEHRKFLSGCLKDIANLLEKKKVTWIRYDEFTKSGHPKHPARKKHENRFKKFDLISYLENFDH